MIDSTYEDKLYQTPKFAGAFRYNVQKGCAALLCRACEDFPVCVAEHYLTLRTGCSRGRTPKVVRPQQRKNPLPFPFSQRSRVGNLRQTLQGKGVIHKRVETAGVYPLVRPRGVSADSARFASALLPMSTIIKIDKYPQKGYTNLTRGYGGIGRRARFRFWCPRRAGSSPVTRTSKKTLWNLSTAFFF